jgi:hypothetical protein
MEEFCAEIWIMKAWWAGFAFLIVADFPALFPGCREKRFTLPWRGNGDGFRARFSRALRQPRAQPDIDPGHGGELFRALHASGVGITADPRLKSFFPLKNPRDFPAGRSALKAEKKTRTIICDSSDCSIFCGIDASDNRKANTRSWSYLGNSSATNNGLYGRTVLTRFPTTNSVNSFRVNLDSAPV